MKKKHQKKNSTTNIKDLFILETEKTNKKYGTTISQFAAFLTREIETLETKNRAYQTTQNPNDEWIETIREYAEQTSNPDYIIDNIDREAIFEETLLDICRNLYMNELIRPLFIDSKENQSILNRWTSIKYFTINRFSEDEIDFLVSIKWK